MKILPRQLIGKVVKDCYTFQDKDMNGHILVIEFTDDTKIQVRRVTLPYGVPKKENGPDILTDLEQ